MKKKGLLTLVSPEDKLLVRRDGAEFKSKERKIPDLGNLSLWGNRHYDYSDPREMGVAIVDNHIVVAAARDLDELGFFETAVKLGGLPKSNIPMICKMLLPKYGLNIESEINFDEDELEGNPEFRWYGYTYKWRFPDSNEVWFFAPGDPKFLSQLQFSFSQVHNIPKNPQ